MLRIAFIPLLRTTFDVPFAEQKILHARQSLLSAGFDLIEPHPPVSTIEDVHLVEQLLKGKAHDLLLIFQATFADSTLVTALSAASHASIFLWAVPEPWSGERLRLNSLCGINLAAHALGLRKQQYAYAYGEVDDPEVMEKILLNARVGSVKRRLQSSHLGVIGEHPDGMDSCHLDAEQLKSVFGVTVEQISLEELFDMARAVSPQAVTGIRAELSQSLDNLGGLDQPALSKTLQVYQALHDLAQIKQLDGLAVRCWPEFFTQLGCAACGAMSMLSDGFHARTPIPCGCEADINGTLTQLILQYFSHAPAFGTDMVGIDSAQDLVALWHCGLAPLTMSDKQIKPQGTIHSNRKMPLLMDFRLKPGAVTLARISQSGGKMRMVLGHGEMIEYPKPFSGTSGTLRPANSAKSFLDKLMKEGLEHHISLTYGNFVSEMALLAQQLDLPILEI